MLRILTTLLAFALSTGAANAVTYQLTVNHEITEFSEGFNPVAGIGVGTTYDTITTFSGNPKQSTQSPPDFFGQRVDVVFENGLGETLLFEPSSTLDPNGSLVLSAGNNVGPNRDFDSIRLLNFAGNGIGGVTNYTTALWDETGSILSGESVADLVAFASAGDLSGLSAGIAFIPMDGNKSTIYGDCTAQNFCSINGQVTGISIAAVPLPASAGFLLAGLMGIGVAGRKRKAI